MIYTFIKQNHLGKFIEGLNRNSVTLFTRQVLMLN